MHARTHTHTYQHSHLKSFTPTYLNECFIIYWKCDRSIARYNISTDCIDDDLITILIIFFYIFFHPFQDKIRLIQDDLESERELRQRVSSIQIICWPDQINPHECIKFNLKKTPISTQLDCRRKTKHWMIAVRKRKCFSLECLQFHLIGGCICAVLDTYCNRK